MITKIFITVILAMLMFDLWDKGKTTSAGWGTLIALLASIVGIAMLWANL